MRVGVWLALFIAAWVVGGATAHVAEAAMSRRRLTWPCCPYCQAPYRPAQWLAISALLTGQSRCASCGRPLRWPRLAGESVVVFAWMGLVVRYGVSWRVGMAMVAVLPLAMIMVTDLEARRVPNVVILPAIAAILVLSTAFGPAMPALRSWAWWHGPLGAGVGFLTLRVLVWVGVALFGEGALGEGDMTLATYIGGVVGFPMVIVALTLTILLGAVGAAVVLVTTRATLRTAIPYGPFLVLGCVGTMLWGAEIVAWFLS